MSTSRLQPSPDGINTGITTRITKRQVIERLWESFSAWLLSIFFDSLIVTCLWLWLNGGFSFERVHFLGHGADPRRAAIIIGFLGYWLIPPLRNRSIVLVTASWFGMLLSHASFRWYFLALTAFGAIHLGIQETLALRYTLFDVGIFHQILWGIQHGFGFLSTISGADNFLMDHNSPSLQILSPFFRYSHESPFFLPFVHVLLIYGGSAAWIFLASRIPGVGPKFRERLAGAVTLFVISFDSFWGNLRWGFHENAIGFFSLSWALAFLVSDNTSTNQILRWVRKFVALCLLVVAAGSKEIFLLNVSFVFFCWIIVQLTDKTSPKVLKSILSGLFILVIIYLVVTFSKFEAMEHPADKNYFARYYAYLGNSVSSVLSTLFHNPKIVVQTIGEKSLWKFAWAITSPWMFLPVLLPVFLLIFRNKASPKLMKLGIIPWWLILFPSLGSIALATYPPLRDPNFHYVLELWPVLMVLTLISLSLIRSSRLNWTWAVFALLLADHDPVRDYRDYKKESQENLEIREQMAKIPPGSPVVADDLTGAWLAGRRWLTRWPNTRLLPRDCPEYILVRFSEEGTLTEIGVKNLLSRCEANLKEPQLNADLIRARPVWQNDAWSLYHVKLQLEPEPENYVEIKNHATGSAKSLAPKLGPTPNSNPLKNPTVNPLKKSAPKKVNPKVSPKKAKSKKPGSKESVYD